MVRFVIDAPVAVKLVTDGASVPAKHSLVAPALLRSDANTLMYREVRAGRIDARAAKKVLDGIRGLRMRLLGDRVLQSVAWDVAAALDWPDTYRAEYVAVTQLQADALVTLDDDFAAAAGTIVRTATLAELLG